MFFLNINIIILKIKARIVILIIKHIYHKVIIYIFLFKSNKKEDKCFSTFKYSYSN